MHRYTDVRSDVLRRRTARNVRNAVPNWMHLNVHVTFRVPKPFSHLSGTNTTTGAPASQQDPPPSPATQRALNPPLSPREGFSVVPGPSRRLQHERPFTVQLDPMWNSTQSIKSKSRTHHLACTVPTAWTTTKESTA